MKKIIIFISIFVFCGVAIADPSYLGTESILNKIFNSSSNALKITLDGDLEMGTNSIDGDATAGLAFDPDNDDTNEITMPAAGGITVGGTNERITGSTNGEYIDFGTDGKVLIQGASGTNNEGLTIDLETTDTVVEFSNPTTAAWKFRIRNTTAADDYMDLYHDGTAGLINTGSGSLIINSDNATYNGTAATAFYQFNSNSSGLFLFTLSDAFDQAGIGVADEGGNQFIFTNLLNWSKDHDHAAQTNPTRYTHSDLSPDVSNNQWGSLAHDQEDFIISTGVNVGTGSAPTTDENAIEFYPRGVLAVEIDGDGGLIPKHIGSDPCGVMKEGSIFYDTVGNNLCYCSAAAADLKVSDNSACY